MYAEIYWMSSWKSYLHCFKIHLRNIHTDGVDDLSNKCHTIFVQNYLDEISDYFDNHME